MTRSMLRLAVTGARRVELREAPLPELRDGDALVRVEAAAICQEWRRFAAGEAGEPLGHEAAGVVVETRGDAGVEPGQRVVAMPLTGCGACRACRSGFYIHCAQAFSEPEAALAQVVRKRGFLCLPLPDDVSFEQGVLACCALGPGFGALEKVAAEPGETVLVTGAGPVGLGAVVCARARGLEVAVVEPQAERAERAAGLGATVVDPGEARDIAAAIECSGAAEAARICIDAVRPLGAVAFVGVGANETAIDRWDDVIRRGVTLTGAWHYPLDAFPRVLEVARTPAAAALVAGSFAFADAQTAFEQAAAGAAKVILRPQEAT